MLMIYNFYQDYIQPVCLPKTTESDLQSGDIVTPTGWGMTHDGKS